MRKNNRYYNYKDGDTFDVGKYNKRQNMFKRHNGTYFYEWMVDWVSKEETIRS